MTHTPAWDDLTVFLSADDFAVPGQISLVDGTVRTVKGIFDWPGVQAELGQYVQDDLLPSFTSIATDLKGVCRGDTIVINGCLYDVLSSPKPDGTGMAVLDLAVSSDAQT